MSISKVHLIVIQDRQLCIVATIHQPSSAQFSLFSCVYILTKWGECAYYGRPQELISTVALMGYHCPPFYNPADFILEVMNEDFGKEGLKLMTHYVNEVNELLNDNINSLPILSEVINKYRVHAERYANVRLR